MKTRILIIIGMIVIASMAYVWAQDTHWHSYDECFKMGKFPKVDKFNDNAYMVSCINLNPFEK